MFKSSMEGIKSTESNVGAEEGEETFVNNGNTNSEKGTMDYNGKEVKKSKIINKDVIHENAGDINDDDDIDVNIQIYSNCGERLYKLGKSFLSNKDEKIKKKKAESEKMLDEQLTFKPKITKKAQSIPHLSGKAYYEFNEVWSKRIQNSLQRKREEKENQSIPCGVVAKNKASQKIVEKKKYQGVITAYDKHVQKYLKTRRGEKKVDPTTFKPNINPNSERLLENSERRQSNANLFDRLYQEANEKQKKLEMTEKTKEELELFDKETGQRLFKPQINRNYQPKSTNNSFGSNSSDGASGSPRNMDVSYEKIPENLLAKTIFKHKHSDSLTFSPRIDPNSERLVENLKMRRPLYSPRTSLELQHSPSSPKNNTKNSPRSPTQLPQEFIQRREEKLSRTKEKLDILRQKKDQEVMKECTFHPSINQNSKKLFENVMQQMEREALSRSNMLLNSSGIANPKNSSNNSSDPQGSIEDGFVRSEVRNHPHQTYHQNIADNGQNSARPIELYSNFSQPISQKVKTAWNITSKQQQQQQNPYTTNQAKSVGFLAADDDDFIYQVERDMELAMEKWRRLESMNDGNE